MANHVTYTRNDGTELRLKLTAERTVDLETRLGDSIQKKLAETDKLSVASEFLAAAIQNGEYNERKKTALDIYDEMTDGGQTLREYLEIIHSVLVSAGFIDAAVLKRQTEAAAAQEKFAKTLHEAEMHKISESIGKMKELTKQPEEAVQN